MEWAEHDLCMGTGSRVARIIFYGPLRRPFRCRDCGGSGLVTLQYYIDNDSCLEVRLGERT